MTGAGTASSQRRQHRAQAYGGVERRAVTVASLLQEADTGRDRLLSMLKTAMGPVLGSLLTDEEVEELAVNEDGRLWEVRHDMRFCTAHRVTAANAERLIRIVADAVSVHHVGPANPSFPAELPGSGYRFHAVVPPQVRSPIFVIRKKPVRIYTLDAYVDQGAMTAGQKKIIEDAVLAKHNLLIVGGTGSGKTTLANAILDVMARTGDRILTVEDTLELVCRAEDKIMMRTVPGVRSMRDCIRDMMRLSPTRIVVGEVRGPEVIDLIGAGTRGIRVGSRRSMPTAPQKAWSVSKTCTNRAMQSRPDAPSPARSTSSSSSVPLLKRQRKDDAPVAACRAFCA